MKTENKSFFLGLYYAIFLFYSIKIYYLIGLILGMILISSAKLHLSQYILISLTIILFAVIGLIICIFPIFAYQQLYKKKWKR